MLINPISPITNFQSLQEEIISLIESHPHDSNQLILQGLNPDNEEWQVGVGSIEELEEKDERLYRHIHKSLEGSEISKIIKEHNAFRARIMIMPPRKCYSVHADPTKRIHIPIVTNDQCWMIWPYNNKCWKLPIGKIYLTDTTQPHTFINGGTEDRIHVVMCVPD